MSADDELKNLETAFRSEVLTNSFAEARVLLARYAMAVEAYLGTAPEPEAARSLEARIRVLFDWSNAMVQATREYAAAELTQLRLSAHYRDAAEGAKRRGSRV